DEAGDAPLSARGYSLSPEAGLRHADRAVVSRGACHRSAGDRAKFRTCAHRLVRCEGAFRHCRIAYFGRFGSWPRAVATDDAGAQSFTAFRHLNWAMGVS